LAGVKCKCNFLYPPPRSLQRDNELEPFDNLFHIVAFTFTMRQTSDRFFFLKAIIYGSGDSTN